MNRNAKNKKYGKMWLWSEFTHEFKSMKTKKALLNSGCFWLYIGIKLIFPFLFVFSIL